MDSFSAELSLLTLLKQESEAARKFMPPSWMDSYSDAQLVDMFKTGSQESMGALYHRYKGLVLSVSQKILHDRNEAEDILQDVFLEVCKRIELFDTARGSVRMWILQYAYSRSLNRRRYLSLRHIELTDSNGNGRRTQQDFEWNGSRSVLDQTILEEHAGMIQEALKGLSSDQQKVIRLAYFHGLSMREIAEQTRDSLVNVRSHYYRGLKKLRHVFSKVLAEGRKRSHVIEQR